MALAVAEKALDLFSESDRPFKVPGCTGAGDLSTSDDFGFVPEMGWFEILVGVVLSIGTIGSVIPQLVKLVLRRNSEGLSAWYLLIQFINHYAATCNITITNATYLHSCAFIGWGCVPPLITWIQNVILTIVYTPQIFFFFPFFPKKSSWIDFKLPLIVTPFVLLTCDLLIASVVILELTDGECGDVTYGFALAYGITSTVCVVIQWTPQIITTFRFKGAGSLSILMLCLTAPGTGVLTIYMIFTTQQDISSWMSNAVSSIEQFILLFACVYYEYVKKHWKTVLLCRCCRRPRDEKPLLDPETSSETSVATDQPEQDTAVVVDPESYQKFD